MADADGPWVQHVQEEAADELGGISLPVGAGQGQTRGIGQPVFCKDRYVASRTECIEDRKRPVIPPSAVGG